jgi:ubiquinone/menaquinone biosynthesis C-methylase UbiE
METNTFEKQTRAVFHSHHSEQANDENIFNRLTTLISPQYFGVDKDFFRDKLILDIACGSNANASYAFLSLGAKKVISADMGTAWMDVAKKKLEKFGNRSEIYSENLMGLSFKDETFDFVHCAGALHHTSDPRHGFNELARVTAKGGITFMTIMGNANGLLYEFINYLRDKYKLDASFRSMIDDLNIDVIREQADWILSEKKKQEGTTEIEEAFIHSLFDADLVLTIKDRIQAPTYHNFDFTEKQIYGWFEEKNFKNIKRITRYTKNFNNLRKYLAPMYHDYNNPLSRFWFGDGYIQMMGSK